jgi:hypothetical protein
LFHFARIWPPSCRVPLACCVASTTSDHHCPVHPRCSTAITVFEDRRCLRPQIIGFPPLPHPTPVPLHPCTFTTHVLGFPPLLHPTTVCPTPAPLLPPHYAGQVDAISGTTFQLTFFVHLLAIYYLLLFSIIWYAWNVYTRGFLEIFLHQERSIVCYCTFPTLNCTSSHENFLLLFWLHIFLKHGSVVLQGFCTSSYWLLLHVHIRMVTCSFLSTLVTAWQCSGYHLH